MGLLLSHALPKPFSGVPTDTSTFIIMGNVCMFRSVMMTGGRAAMEVMSVRLHRRPYRFQRIVNVMHSSQDSNR